MTTVNDILQYMNILAPESMKMDWDHVGLLCGRKDQIVKKILISLDPSVAACKEAAKIGADLLLTHHPLIFHPLDAVTYEDPTGLCVLTLAENHISAINAHTNLDQSPEGVNHVLATVLGLQDIFLPEPEGINDCGKPWGLLRGGTVEAQSIEQFLQHVKEALSCPGVRYVDGGKPVHRVVVGGGACGSGLKDAVKHGFDTFVTSDVKYNQFLDAAFYGINLIDAGHFYTENPVCTYLKEKVQENFPDLEVILFDSYEDPMKFF